MPTYTYTCTTCNDLIEKRQSFSDPRLTTCAQCGGTLRKVIHPVGIVFKGTGFYVNDYKNKESGGNGKSRDSSSSDPKSSTEKGSSEKGSSEKSSSEKGSSEKSSSESKSASTPAASS